MQEAKGSGEAPGGDATRNLLRDIYGGLRLSPRRKVRESDTRSEDNSYTERQLEA